MQAGAQTCNKSSTLTESLAILGRFKLNGHIDPALFDLFMREPVEARMKRSVIRGSSEA